MEPPREWQARFMTPWNIDHTLYLQKTCPWRKHLAEIFHMKVPRDWASVVAQMAKNLPANVGNLGSIPGSGQSLGGGHGYPLQYSCLENSVNRGAWLAKIHRATKSQTPLTD